jgi:ribonuclease R
MHDQNQSHRSLLTRIARQAMAAGGLLPDFSREALAELALVRGPSIDTGEKVRDLRELLWSSIDNDDSLDLDQLTVAAAQPPDGIRIFVAIADVDSMVRKDAAIDAHAKQNTTSVYTAAAIFPMLPERLSTDITSLNYNADRRAIVIEMTVGPDGLVKQSDICLALVRNRAKLAYNSVAAWLEGGTLPAPVAAVPGLADNLKLQDKAAQGMKNLRHVNGALSLETIEARPVFSGDEIRELETEKPNRAKSIIEDFMIAANGVTARFLSSKNFPSLRRVVRVPKRWEKIVAIAGMRGYKLPEAPEAKALEDFLTKERVKDPLRFPDLSLAVIKLMGPGEYVADVPGEAPVGHFGLAVKDYNHSTAPNRRYPDLVTQRLLKAALRDTVTPYDKAALDELGAHCTDAEDRAKKVERRVAKSAAALLLESRIGERFEAIVTGAGDKGTWVRLLEPPVEGKLAQGFEGADVGDKLNVQLTHTDVERGFIDFKKV